MNFSITKNTNSACTGNITERVKTFEDACDVLAVSGIIAEFKLNDGLDDMAKSIQAFIKLQMIAKALNEGWQPDWSDTDTRKWFPYFDLEDGFSLYHVDYNYGFARVGSRLCFKNEALARYAATQFIELYKDFMLFQ